MNVTVSLIVATITLIAGQIFKILPFPNKYIPLQNLIIAIASSIICIIFRIENMSILETIITCTFASMSAGGIADMKKLGRKENDISNEENPISKNNK